MSHRRPDAEEAAHLQYEIEHVSPRGKSVVPYLVILVVVAFVLLLVAFMQERTNQSVEGLNQSADSIRNIDQLVGDNRALQEKVDKLQGELDTAQDQNAALASQAAQLQSELDAAREQLEALTQPSEEPTESPAP